jgi:hypothetical protein
VSLLALMALLAGCQISGDFGQGQFGQGQDGKDGISVTSGEVGKDGAQIEQRSVERQGAESVAVDVVMGAGQLDLSGGAAQLLDATFIYTEPSWKPEVEYRVEGTRGYLEIRQGDVDSDRVRVNARNEWTLRMSNDIPMDLRLDMGAGLSQLDLRGLDLDTLNVSKGAGQMGIDLSGDRRRDVTADIESGAGLLTITLPQTIGVRVEVDTGVGIVNAAGFMRDGNAYVNDAFGESPVTIQATVRLGAGVLSLDLAS